MTSLSTCVSLKKFVESLSETDSLTHRAAFLHFCQALVGSNVEATLADGKQFKGIFYTATPFAAPVEYKVAIKAIENKGLLNENESALKLGSTVILSEKALASVTVTGLDLKPPPGSGAELMTDAAVQRRDISHLNGRNLETAAAWLAPDTFSSLESTAESRWDQFETNTRLFNVKSTYDENLYTSKLDKSKMSREQIERAIRLAKEIESQTSTNIHLQEERGHLQEREFDEEDMYSGVLRTSDVNEKGSDKGSWKKGGPSPSGGGGGSASRAASGAPLTRSASRDSVATGLSGNSWRRAVTGTPPVVETKVTAPVLSSPGVAKVSSTLLTPPPGLLIDKRSSLSPIPATDEADKLADALAISVTEPLKEETKVDTKPDDAADERTEKGGDKSNSPDSSSSSSAPKAEDRPAAPTTSKLRADAKPFVFNSAAAEFKPAAKPQVPPIPAPYHGAQSPQDVGAPDHMLPQYGQMAPMMHMAGGLPPPMINPMMGMQAPPQQMPMQYLQYMDGMPPDGAGGDMMYPMMPMQMQPGMMMPPGYMPPPFYGQPPFGPGPGGIPSMVNMIGQPGGPGGVFPPMGFMSPGQGPIQMQGGGQVFLPQHNMMTTPNMVSPGQGVQSGVNRGGGGPGNGAQSPPHTPMSSAGSRYPGGPGGPMSFFPGSGGGPSPGYGQGQGRNSYDSRRGSKGNMGHTNPRPYDGPGQYSSSNHNNNSSTRQVRNEGNNRNDVVASVGGALSTQSKGDSTSAPQAAVSDSQQASSSSSSEAMGAGTDVGRGLGGEGRGVEEGGGGNVLTPSSTDEPRNGG